MDPPSVVPFFLLYIIPILAILVLTKCNRYKVKGLNLPPGTTGFPLIGETIQFAKPYPSTTVGKFIEERVQKYGKIFTTHLMGKSTVISTDLEFNQFVLKNDGVLFQNDVPKSVKRVFGADITEQRTSPSLRAAIHEFLSVPHVRSHFLEDFEKLTLETLQSWRAGIEFSAIEEVSKVSFYLMMKSLFRFDPTDVRAKTLFKFYHVISKGVRSIPVNIPGTMYRRAAKASEALRELLKHLSEEWLELGYKDDINLIHQKSDHLSKLLKKQSLSMEQLTTHILSVIFASHETTSTALGLLIYFLGRCPEAMKQLKEEHDKIACNTNMKGESKITWEDINQMEFTQHVIKETMRLGNVASVLQRIAMSDIKIKGYDIPKGWGVMIIIAAPHLDAGVFKEPTCFNPWRWQDARQQKQMMESYMPFSKGFHKCAGYELAKMEMSVFIHHLVTKYDWELTENDPPQTSYGWCGFVKGLPIKVYSKSPKITKL